VNHYTVWVHPKAWKEIKYLPGNIRQRVRRAIDDFSDNPIPQKSKKLNMPNVKIELYRLRIERWRIVYAITKAEKAIDILAIRKRPPYDYKDLEKLLEDLL